MLLRLFFLEGLYLFRLSPRTVGLRQPVATAVAVELDLPGGTFAARWLSPVGTLKPMPPPEWLTERSAFPSKRSSIARCIPSGRDPTLSVNARTPSPSQKTRAASAATFVFGARSASQFEENLWNPKENKRMRTGTSRVQDPGYLVPGSWNEKGGTRRSLPSLIARLSTTRSSWRPW